MYRYLMFNVELQQVVGVICANTVQAAIDACPAGCQLMLDWPISKQSGTTP